jgi:hypothetical protein
MDGPRKRSAGVRSSNQSESYLGHAAITSRSVISSLVQRKSTKKLPKGKFKRKNVVDKRIIAPSE